MKRPFGIIGLTLFFVTAFFFDFETGVTATAFAVFAAALVISLLFRNIRKHGFLPLFFASGAVSCALLIGAVNFLYLPVMSYDGMNDCVLKVQTTDDSQIRYGNCYIDSKVLSVNGEEADFDIRLVFSSPPEVQPYDIIEGKFNIYALGSSDESVSKSYKSQGVFLGAYPVNESYTVTQIAEGDKPFAKKFIDFRAAVKRSVYRVFPDDRGGLAVALTIGDQYGLSDEIDSDFQKIGISHIICVSGFHLSLWSLFVLNILKKTGMKKWLADIIAAVCVVFIMGVAGFTNSVIRAGIMMLVFLLGDIFMRQRDSLNSLGFALTVIAVIKPFSSGSVSLKLSVLATLGIILYNEYFSPSIKNVVSKIKYKRISRIILNVISSLMITVSATAFTLPVSLKLYGSFNFLCFVANLIIVPLAGLSMVFSSASALWGALFPGVYNVFGSIAGLMLKLMIGVSHRLAEYDFLTFRLNEENVAVLLGGLFVFCLIAVLVSCLIKPVYGFASVLCAFIFTVSIVAFSNHERKETKITAVDCGDGISVVVSHNGENILLGCGGTDFFGADRISDVLNSCGGEIDVAVIADESETYAAYVNKVFARLRPEKLYSDSLPDGAELLLRQTEKSAFSSVSGCENINAQSVVINGCSCVYLQTDDTSALVCFKPSFRFDDLPSDFRSADIIISYGNFPQGSQNHKNKIFILAAEGIRSEIIKETMTDNGLRCYTTEYGNVVIRAENTSVSVNS